MTMNPPGADDTPTAAAGWYPDPHEPGSLRYFDGQVWTEHRHNQGDGGLPDLGAWLSSSFSVVGENFVPAALLSFVLQFIGSVMVWLIVRWAVGDLAIKDQELVNFGSSQVVGAVALIVVFALWRGFSTIARDRFMQRAHMQATPTIADALQRAAVRLPKWIGVYLVIAAAWVLAFAIAGLIFAFAGPVLGVLFVVALVVAAVFVWVRLAFVSAAVAAAPAKQSVFASSIDISRGRFWPTLGRLILVMIGAAVIGQLAGWMSQGVTATVDSNAFVERFAFEPTDTELGFKISDFAISELLPSVQSFLVFGTIAAVLGSLLALLMSSAIMRLYLEAGGDSDVSSGGAA